MCVFVALGIQIIIRVLSGCAIFFHLISHTSRFSGGVIEHNMCFEFLRPLYPRENPGRHAPPSKLNSELCHCSFIPLLPPAPPSLHNSVTLRTMYKLPERTYYDDCIQMLLTKTHSTYRQSIIMQHHSACSHMPVMSL